MTDAGVSLGKRYGHLRSQLLLEVATLLYQWIRVQAGPEANRKGLQGLGWR